MNTSPAGYDRQVEAQIAQYADGHDMHEGAPAAQWLHQRFIAGKMQTVFATDSVVELFATYLAEAVRRSGIDEVVSLGSGYGALEIDIATWVRDRGLTPFRLTCLELSPILAEKARAAISVKRLDGRVSVIEADLNRPLPIMRPVAAFMANHSLHHLLGLEQLFDHIVTWMHPEGAFVAVDMIGRNGHMRWPEVLAVVRAIWPHLPDRLKWDHMFHRLDRWYENWDCSIEGFEGIRAQDILPALLQAGIGFERFFATGGLTDVFYDRRFGGNFALDNPRDVRFLEQVQALENWLLANGRIKPVGLFAVMRSPRSTTCPRQPVCFGGITPERAVRGTDDAPAEWSPIWPERVFSIPYLPISPSPLVAVDHEAPIQFGRAAEGQDLLRWGWGDPEDDFTWSVGHESALAFTVVRVTGTIDLHFIAYEPPAGEQSTLSVTVNGDLQQKIDLSTQQSDGHRLRLRKPLLPGSSALLELSLSRPRRPNLDGGDDKRPIGLALISITLG